ncbi:MAG: hypothetical protein VX899_23145 [Myxococcota bacterium]|nr:hypothetical protein [Myxococcota bacterium]
MLLPLLLACAEPGDAQSAVEGDFTLPDSRGQEHSLSDYAGKVLLLDLSAFW